MSEQAEFLKRIVKRARAKPQPSYEAFEDTYRLLLTNDELEQLSEIAYRIERLEK